MKDKIVARLPPVHKMVVINSFSCICFNKVFLPISSPSVKTVLKQSNFLFTTYNFCSKDIVKKHGTSRKYSVKILKWYEFQKIHRGIRLKMPYWRVMIYLYILYRLVWDIYTFSLCTQNPYRVRDTKSTEFWLKKLRLDMYRPWAPEIEGHSRLLRESYI